MTKCTHCKREIVLVPSAEQRAKKTGYPAQYFRGLFTMHADCTLELRRAGTSGLIARLKGGCSMTRDDTLRARNNT